MSKEHWKKIRGFPKYWISDHGRIWSEHVRRIITNQRRSGQYHTFNLRRDNTGACKHIHRIVAEHFIPNPNHYPCVNHKDNDPDNNHIDNLQWCTHKMNSDHYYSNGGQSYGRHRSKLTDYQREWVIQNYSKGDHIFGLYPMSKILNIRPYAVTTILKKAGIYGQSAA